MRHRGLHPSVCPLRWKDAVASALRSVGPGGNTAQRQTFNIQCLMSTAPRVFRVRVSAALLPVRCPLTCFQTLYKLRITVIAAVNVSTYAHIPRPRAGSQTTRTRCVTHRFDLPPLTPQLRIAGGRQDDSREVPGTTSNQPLQRESIFGDSSGPLFSIYSKAAEDEDNKMVERWQKDADGILIFVSHRVDIRLSLHINRITIDRSILCCSRCTPCRDGSGPQAEQSGYLRILPWQHLPGSRRPERNPLIHSSHYR